jgi:hypothetical protein
VRQGFPRQSHQPVSFSLRLGIGLDCFTRLQVRAARSPLPLVVVSAPDNLFAFHSSAADGCSGPGDLISDTPAEARESFKCEIGRDTCPSPGDDPIRNFMDYSEDNCLSNFTTKQRQRMIAQWYLYRVTGYAPPTPPVPPPPTSISSSSNHAITIKVGTDKYAEETGWTLKQGNTLLYTQAPGTYSGAEQTYVHTFNNLAPSVYTFAVTDAGLDGLCCEWGFGGFEITSGKKVFASGDDFTESMSVKFKIVE